MRQPLIWFRQLTNRSKLAVFGTMISTIGIIPGYAGLFTTSNNDPNPADPTSQYAPASPVSVTNSVGSQVITGDNNLQIGNIGNVDQLTINAPAQPTTGTVLDNSGQPTLILKSISSAGNPLIHATKPENQLGIAPVDTEIRVLDLPPVTKPNPMLSFQKIEVLDGDLKGQTGWVSKNTIRSKEFLR